jgi:ABC-2 type transport system ATP-binding protein
VVALDTSPNLKRLISGTNNIVLQMDIPNLSPALVEGIRSLGSVKSVSEDSSTHLKIIASGDDAFDSLIDAVRKNGGKIASMENVQPTLEDVFLHLTGHEVRDSADQKIPLERHRGFMGGTRRIR